VTELHIRLRLVPIIGVQSSLPIHRSLQQPQDKSIMTTEKQVPYDNVVHAEATPSDDGVITKRTGSLTDANLMNEAYVGENREHEQTVWQAIKAQPLACLFAIAMCFTIVREHYQFMKTS
jgi:hypothetical protein